MSTNNSPNECDQLAGQAHADLSLTSIAMHAVNVLVMLAEFSFNALAVRADSLGLLLSWSALYGLFNGLQAIWTWDPVYFFMDFTIAKTPFVALGLTILLCAIFAATVGLSALKVNATSPRRRRSFSEPTPKCLARPSCLYILMYVLTPALSHRSDAGSTPRAPCPTSSRTRSIGRGRT